MLNPREEYTRDLPLGCLLDHWLDESQADSIMGPIISHGG